MRNEQSSRVPLYIVALFTVCLVTLTSTGIMNYHILGTLKRDNDWMVRTWGVKRELKNIDSLMVDVEDSLRGYFISGNPHYLEPWHAAPEKLAAGLSKLTGLVEGNATQTACLAKLRALYDQKTNEFEESVRSFDRSGLPSTALVNRMEQGTQTMDRIRAIGNLMQNSESTSLKDRRAHFFVEYNEAIWAGILINTVATVVLILFFRLIKSNCLKQRLVEEKLKEANDNLESIVQVRTRQLSVLSRHLLVVCEEEKAKLARELHDELGSNLTAISMDISSVRDQLQEDEPALARQLQRAKQTLVETIDLKRRIMENLRPSMLDNLGLAASIRHHCAELAQLSGLEYKLDIEEDFDNIDPAISIALFRITQEALNNTIKYADATQVNIRLQRRPGGLSLQILDDGIGIPDEAFEKSKSHGLLGMRERALLLDGSFSIRRGANNRGCAIDVFLPLTIPSNPSMPT